MSWKKYINIWNVLLLALTVSLGFFGMRWLNAQAPIGVPEEYQNIDLDYPTYEPNSTLHIDHTNVDSLPGNGTSSNPYILEDGLFTEYSEDQGEVTLTIYNVSHLEIRSIRLEGPAAYYNRDGLVISDCDNITIKDSFFMNYDDAVRIEDCGDVLFTNNTLYHSTNGVFVDQCEGSMVVSENFAVSNGFGIYISQTDNTMVLNNTIVGSGEHAINFIITDHGQISGNNILYNQDAGAVFLDPDSGFNTVSYNTITDCVGYWFSEGTEGDNTVQNNTVTYSKKTLGLIILASGGVPALTLIGLLIRAAVKQRSVTKHFKKTKKEGEFWVFFSYATVNSKMYRIPELAKRLEIYEDINEVFYWEDKMTDDIFEYMEKYIKDCDVILLFCSQDALASEAVKKEWMSSLKIEKKIIPIFKDPMDIPALLTTKLGVQYDPENFDKFVNDVYELIKKKTQIG